MLPLKLKWDEAQTKWASEINPVLANLLVQGQLLVGIPLINGVTVVNHKLQRPLVGWMLAGGNATAVVYDSQDTNQTPQTNLVLHTTAACTVNLWVF